MSEKDYPNKNDNLNYSELLSDNDYYLYEKSDKDDYPIILEIKGNIDTPYEGGVFIIEINPENIKFITKICSIYVDINNGELLQKNIIKYNLTNIINFIKNKILISPNTTELIENELNQWTGKETYFNYLSKIKTYTQQHANKDGKKIKVDKNLLSNQDFSKYKNFKNKLTGQAYRKVIKEFNEETNLISEVKSKLNINLTNLYFCPFNNFNQIYFEFLGEQGTPYEGGVFVILFEIDKDYPFRLGKCVFRTKIFHNKFDENNSSVCEIEFNQIWYPALSLYYICLYYYKVMNSYDYICFKNKNARKLIYSNFNEFLQVSKNYTKKYANIEGIKFKPDLHLIEKSFNELNIIPPVEKDFMPKVIKEYDKNIKEEELDIIFQSFSLSGINKINLKVKSTDFIIDICLRLREYIINNKSSLTKDSNLKVIGDYKNLVPIIIIPDKQSRKYMSYGKQIGSYGIKNSQIIKIFLNVPTCNSMFIPQPENMFC